ncbi:unnamed protein product [Linum trigynum]|uniref:F-box protein At3g26010-like beta-propeller domain-containing protein n=1 Tax=Linum trigynum TaxID=586398 RepID=A0AAV2DTB2_9ROSI
MDRGKKQGKFIANKNNKIYMDLKDIIREVALPFLPAKSLRRCTTVCREWKLQISTPFFAHSQSNSFHDLSGFFCRSTSGEPTFIPLDPMAYGVADPSFSFLPEPVHVRCSSNGLVCCQGRSGQKPYYVCNPVTKQWTKLPKPNADHGSDPSIVIAFEPSLLNFVADYKLICAFPSDLDGCEFEIYSSATKGWRISNEICFGDSKLMSSPGVYAGGSVYWRSKTRGILAFNLTSERSTIQSSCGYSDSSSGEICALGFTNGKLAVASITGPRLKVFQLSNTFTNTMQMNSRASAWNMNHEAVIESFLFEGNRLDQASAMFVGGDTVVIKAAKALVCYNMRTRRFSTVAADVDFSSKMVPYVNSLVEM